MHWGQSVCLVSFFLSTISNRRGAEMKHFGIINFSHICITKPPRKRHDKCEGPLLEKELSTAPRKILRPSAFPRTAVSENEMKALKKVILSERKIPPLHREDWMKWHYAYENVQKDVWFMYALDANSITVRALLCDSALNTSAPWSDLISLIPTRRERGNWEEFMAWTLERSKL